MLEDFYVGIIYGFRLDKDVVTKVTGVSEYEHTNFRKYVHRLKYPFNISNDDDNDNDNDNDKYGSIEKCISSPTAVIITFPSNSCIFVKSSLSLSLSLSSSFDILKGYFNLCTYFLKLVCSYSLTPVTLATTSLSKRNP